MGTGLSTRLLESVGEGSGQAGVSVRGVYRSAVEAKVMPPTFPEGSVLSDGVKVPYLVEPRQVDGERRERTVVLDQVPSQANRVEEALLAARDAGRLGIPLFVLRAVTSHGPVRLTSLEFPHRYADAYLRDSLVEGVAFDKSEVGKRLREVRAEDARGLFELDPGSLVFGAWDSHRKGRWPKFARFYTSSMFGLDPEVGARRSIRFDPLNLQGGIDDKGKAEDGWKFVPEGTKSKGTKLSEIGHGNAMAKTPPPGGVSISEARRDAWISLAGLERVRFGDASPEAARAARATLLALALAGDRLAFDRPSLFLRSGCDLVRVREAVAFEGDGGRVEEVEVSAADAVAAFTELRQHTAELGLEMSTETVELAPNASLAQAIEFAVAKATAED
ncbi:type I-U CRISPR-associated RAMP protein Csb1/Cas7u [Actinocorallia sp. API 0066]|uniref:type I-G CRISPR-associated RAMP protein Csb1/Cas7g n=1 Tax=Actinocorallia sp. API 0066 TaxID=2896846 RepID=UPI001E2FA605|nr:type I-U CRISPR-associated RAMP protein Csb1/Cas7u [Actinocorallia sp. API 0066]MCD0449407.1 type I-U CRISPR-associated RAMP protein Csb1/Cas7u [Actinocorallia sp. API 0066]